VSPLAARILDALRERPRYFAEVAALHMDVPWREFLRAWGEVRDSPLIGRQEYGRYLVKPETSAGGDGPAPPPLGR
jgi:hypothetical protein